MSDICCDDPCFAYCNEESLSWGLKLLGQYKGFHGGIVTADWIVHHKGEDSFIAVENSSLSLLQTYVLRTTKIFHAFTHNASLISVLPLILFWTTCQCEVIFILFLSLAHWLSTMDRTTFSYKDNSQSHWLPSHFWPWIFLISRQEFQCLP